MPPTPSAPSLARQLAAAFAAWTLVGIVAVQSGAGALALGGHAVPWPRLLGVTFASMWLWALYTPAIARAAQRWPVLGRTRRAPHYAVHLGIALGLTAIDAVVLRDVQARLSAGAAADGIAETFFKALTINLISYVVVAAIGSAGLLLRQLRDEEARSARLSAQLANAQISALRAQLHPHFFFNALNAIAELIHRDPDAADRTVARLGAFLRHSLAVTDRQEIALEEELTALEAYLDVVRLRFRDRVRVEMEVEPDALAARVPPLVLQPLVENALRHGLEPLERGGTLRVAARRAAGELRLEVEDDGAGLPPGGPAREGIGLRNTRDRLLQLYGPAASLSLSPRPGGGAAAEVRLPFHEDEGLLPAHPALAAAGGER